MIRKHRTYLPRIVGDKVMMPADLKRPHKYMLDVEHIGIISDEMREVVEELWPSWRTSCRQRGNRGKKDVRFWGKADMPRRSEVFRSDANDPEPT
jgi:hypothetical protein